MTAEIIILKAKGVYFYSDNDESAFFSWLDKIGCIESYRGQGDVLYINIVMKKLDDIFLREIIAIFNRYQIEMSQLSVFKDEIKRPWFSDTQSYWFAKVFGDKKGSGKKGEQSANRFRKR
jgi:hypothetical protein